MIRGKIDNDWDINYFHSACVGKHALKVATFIMQRKMRKLYKLPKLQTQKEISITKLRKMA